MNSLFRISTWYLKLIKFANARASQELIAAKMNLVNQTGQILQGTNISFPDYLKGVAKPVYPQQGVAELTNLEGPTTPSSLSVELAISRPPITLAQCTTLPAVTEHRQNAVASGSNSSSRHTGIRPGSDIQENDHTNPEDLWG